MNQTQLISSAAAPTLWEPQGNLTPDRASEVICAFLDAATTSFGRATHYNSRQEQQSAELAAHEGLFSLERDLYAALMALPGVSDRSRQVGLKKLLGSSRGAGGFLSGEQERELLYRLVQSLPPQRMLKLLDALRVGDEQLGIPKANNARTRKLILRTLLSSPRLQLWAVKYRSKVRRALVHAWGRRMASIIRAILSKLPEERDAKENAILTKQVARFAATPEMGAAERTRRLEVALQAVGFVLGIRERLSLPLFRAFVAAKADLGQGARLPPEVLEGIRSTYHRDVPKESVLELTKRTMTAGQKVAVQKRAKAAGIEVQADFRSQDAVRLYIYAFENGLSREVQAALEAKAARAAARFPTRFARVGILVDASRSMTGDRTQRLRPMAVALALRDMLSHTAEEAQVVYAGGEELGGLMWPTGATELAGGFLAAVAGEPDAIFVISDGYENAPAGRFGEVLEQVRGLGMQVPVYHLNPVFAAEAVGVRELAPGLAPTLPVLEPGALGTTFVRGMVEAEPIRGINALLRVALGTGSAERKVST